MTQNDFINELKKLNIEITDKQLKELEEYYNLLVEWNEKINLTSITQKDQVYLKHFYDSLTISKVIDLSKVNTLCDVGTGAGFPGLVLKIVFPNLKVTLVDSLNKRINFLNEVIKKLGLENINTIHVRAEEYSKTVREKYDVVTARAVASLPILMEYCVPLVNVDSFFIPLKSNIEEELENSKNKMKKMSVILEKKVEFSLPVEGSKRTILMFKKIEKTPKLFPRKYSDIIKKPL